MLRPAALLAAAAIHTKAVPQNPAPKVYEPTSAPALPFRPPPNPPPHPTCAALRPEPLLQVGEPRLQADADVVDGAEVLPLHALGPLRRAVLLPGHAVAEDMLCAHPPTPTAASTSR